jgi:hypothetical protein
MAKNKLCKIILTLSLLIFTGQGNSQELRYGNLSLLISQIRNAMPGQNSNAFVIPTTTQMDSFRTITQYILQENYTMADSFARDIGYGLYEWYDTAWDSTRYYILMEPNASVIGGVQLGWGTFIFYSDGDDEIIIEVPHPYFDTNTWQVGFRTYQFLENRYFLMAGTHRYANGTNPRPADVAHNTQNMFHIVHQEVSPLSVHAMQIHGFSRNNHPGYPDVVLSNGTPNPGQILDSLAHEIISESYTVGIFDGINWTALGATTNKQGQFSNANGYSFIHMELEYFIRNNASHWENFVDIVYRVFYVPTSLSVHPNQFFPENVLLYPNYPNPFNSSTIISWQLTAGNSVSLALYNLRGQKLKTLLSAYMLAGLHSIQFDASGLSSGIYWVVVQAGSETYFQKISLVK